MKSQNTYYQYLKSHSVQAGNNSIMENLSKFCTCQNLNCPLHPTKHNKGCALCISKNLHLKEIPNCFFNLIENAEDRNGDSFEDFAEIISNKRKSEMMD